MFGSSFDRFPFPFGLPTSQMDGLDTPNTLHKRMDRSAKTSIETDDSFNLGPLLVSFIPTNEHNITHSPSSLLSSQIMIDVGGEHNRGSLYVIARRG